jgi:type VI secretion system VasD/TssJ family lipoprotein
MGLKPALLLICLALGGCTALSKMGQVLLDPSVPIGAPGDRPSQCTLSLHASHEINPNPYSLLDQDLLGMGLDPAPAAVHVSAANPLELTDKLQTLIDTLRREYPAMSSMEQDLPPRPAMSAVVEMGNYQDASVQFAPSGAPLAGIRAMTPIAFQVLQLKDDSMLLHATYEALAQDLKKALGSTLVRADDYRLMPGQFKFVDLEELDISTRYLAVIAHYHKRDDTHWKRLLPMEPRGRKHAVLVRFAEDGVVIQGDSR